MPVKRKSGAPLKVPCTDDLYWKLTAEGGKNRKTATKFALFCLEKATKNTKLASKKSKE